MSLQHLQLALLIGLDNLLIGLALGLSLLSAQQHRRLSLGFGLAEATMPLIGTLLIGKLLTQNPPDWLTLTALLVLAGTLTTTHLLKRSPPVLLNSLPLAIALPILTSLDNLSAGLSLPQGPQAIPLALAIGLIAAALAAAGMTLGKTLGQQRHIRPHHQLLAAISLTGIALLSQ